MYDELIKVLRTCSDPNSYCEDCAYYEKCFKSEEHFSITDQAADAIEELLASCKNFESALKDSVEECEKLQIYVDLYKDLTEKSQKAATEFKQRLQKSEEDNVNLTGWLAEEHANKCPHYIHNVHDRGDDSLCDKWVCEVKSLPKWIPVTERLPNCNGCYLVWRPHFFGGEIGMPSICYFDGSNTWHDSYGVDFARILHPEDVTHWTPLPQPPEREG